jgi:hypothetical protein
MIAGSIVCWDELVITSLCVSGLLVARSLLGWFRLLGLLLLVTNAALVPQGKPIVSHFYVTNSQTDTVEPNSNQLFKLWTLSSNSNAASDKNSTNCYLLKIYYPTERKSNRVSLRLGPPIWHNNNSSRHTHNTHTIFILNCESPCGGLMICVCV